MMSLIDLNVGGVRYTTTFDTLVTRFPDSRLARYAHHFVGVPSPNEDDFCSFVKDCRGRWFIDRDGFLFRFVLDYVRTGILTLPEGFLERERLCVEADHFDLLEMRADLTHQMATQSPSRTLPLSGSSPATSADFNRITFSISDTDRLQLGKGKFRCWGPGYITVGYRGTFYCGGRADGQSDVRFRKVSRILVGGRVSLCRLVFGDALNESRNPEHSQYSARFYLKHTFVEQAFDCLLAAGFDLVAACGTGTNGGSMAATSHVSTGLGRAVTEPRTTRLIYVSPDTEESKWNHYNEFVFCRF